MWFDEEGTPVVEEDDQCATCKYFRKVQCPLIIALSHKFVAVVPEGGFKTTDCALYAEYGTHLKIVK